MISILLPTYNGTKYIKGAIESVLAQSFKEWELIIIDDGSIEDAKEKIEKYLLGDTKIRFLKNQINLGIARSLNIGLQNAKGEYIARIDDDDRWIDPIKLEKQVVFLQAHPEYVLVGTSGVVIDENEKKIANYNVPATDENIRGSILLKNPFISSSVLFRKDAAIKVGGYYQVEDIKSAEDYDLWLKLGLLGKFANIVEPMTFYMARLGNISFNNKKDIFKNNLTLIKKYKNLYPKHLSALLLTKFKYFIFNTLKVFGNTEIEYKIYNFIYRQYIKFTIYEHRN